MRPSDFLRRLLLAVSVCWLAWGLPVCAADDHTHAGSSASTEGHAETGHGAGEPDYNKPPLMPDPRLFVFTLVLFGLFVWVMGNAVWGPLMQGLNAREVRIAEAEAEARSARREVEALSGQAEKRLAETQEQVAKILAQARADAEVRKSEIVAQAEQRARQVREEALADLARARDEALRDLDAAVDRQSALAAEHVAGRQF